MKRILFVLVLALAIVGKGLPIEQANASSVTYCSHYVSQGVCEETQYSLGDFLNALAEDDRYYTSSSFEIVSDTYVSFKTVNFIYYIPFWVIEYRFDTEDYSGGTFTASEWEVYDENLNLIPDDFEDYSEEFEDDYEWYTDTYKLDLWWDNDNRLPIILGYETEDGVLGHFTAGEDDYFTAGTPHLVIDVFYEEEYIVGTIAHELFHAVQYGYVDGHMEFMVYSSFTEGTAKMIETKLPGSSTLSYWDFEDIAALSSPEDSVFGDILECSEDHCEIDGATYGSFLWYSYLHQYQGKSIIKAMLEAFSDLAESDFSEELVPYYSYLAVSQALEEQGTTIEEVYGEFAIKTYDRDDYTDGKFLPDVKILETHTSNSGSFSVDDGAPALFGSNYIEFDTEDHEGYLAVDFTGNQDALFYLSFIPLGKDRSPDHNATERYYMDFAETGVIYIPLDEYDAVIMVVSPVSVSDLEAEDIFNDYIYPYSYAFSRSDSIPEDALEETESTESSGSIFSDVDTGDDNAIAISYLKDNGIVGGYEDGSFKPENPLNRAELLKILVEGVGIDPDSTQYANCFPDVTTDWYAKYVCYAKEQGWIEGYSDNTFRPADEVNKVEAIKMLLEVFAVETSEPTSSSYTDVITSEWYAKYIVKAEELGLLEETGSYSPASSITRGGVSENIYRLLIQQ